MKMTKHKMDSGFTIIELLIATSVFTLVLILLTTGTLAVSRLYYKGIIAAQTQTAARNVLDTVTQSIQFSGASFSPASLAQYSYGPAAFCIGSEQFSFQLNQEVSDSPVAHHALLERNVGNNCSTTGIDQMNNPSTSPPSSELLSAHMSLNNLDVEPVNSNSSLFCVSIRIIYGDSALLTTPVDAQDSCGTWYKQQQCSGALDQYIGGQFCAVSGLDTYVQERVAPT
jgi:competence protein ComGC